MAAPIEAKLRISAEDRTAKVFASLEARLRKAQRVSEEMNRRQAEIDKVNTFRAKHQAVAAGIGQFGSLAVGALGGMGAAASIKSYAALERQMTRIGIAAGASEAETQSATKEVARLASELALPLDQAYAGLDSLVATGKNLPDAMAFLPSILKTAQATGAATEDMSASANALATSFKVASGEMQNAFDVLVVGGQLGQFELRDMAQYLPSVTASAAKLGFVGLEGTKRLVAMLQTVRQVSGESSEAATAVRDAMEKTLSPTVAANFRKHGVDIGRVLDDAARKGENGFEAVLDVLRRLTGGMSDTQRNILISSIYTDSEARRAVTGMINLKDSYLGYVNAVNNSAGATEENLRRVIADPQARVDRLSNSLKELTNELGSFLDGLGVTSGATVLTDAMKTINEPRERQQAFIDAVEKGKEGMSTWERIKFNVAASPEEVRAMAVRGGWRPDPTDTAADAKRRQDQATNDILAAETISPVAQALGFGGRADLAPTDAEYAKLLRTRAEAEAAALWGARDAGKPVAPPAWLNHTTPFWSNVGDRAAPVPLPQPNPWRAIPLPEANPLRITSPLSFPADAAGPGGLDALRDAMDQGGAEAASAILDAARQGSQMLEQAAATIEQSIQNGARALATTRVQVQAPAWGASRPAINANVGQSMPDAGMPGTR